MMRVRITDQNYAEWNGSHTVTYYYTTVDGELAAAYDVSTLYPSSGRKPTQLEMFSAILRRIKDMQDNCDHPYLDDCGKTCHHLECLDCGLLIDTPDVYLVDDEDRRYCKHGTFVGDPYGPDYMCGACEDGE